MFKNLPEYKVIDRVQLKYLKVGDVFINPWNLKLTTITENRGSYVTGIDSEEHHVSFPMKIFGLSYIELTNLKLKLVLG